MTADFASSSPEAVENAELPKTVGWGWAPRDAFFPSWGGAEADHEMRPERQGASGTRAPVESCVMPGEVPRG